MTARAELHIELLAALYISRGEFFRDLYHGARWRRIGRQCRGAVELEGDQASHLSLPHHLRSGNDGTAARARGSENVLLAIYAVADGGGDDGVRRVEGPHLFTGIRAMR